MRPLLSALLAVVAAAAAVSSFSALHSLARMCAFGGTAPLLPLLVDAGAAAGTLVWLTSPPGPARSYGRGLALALLGLSVAGNALAHGLASAQAGPHWLVVVAVSAVAPAVLGAVVHLAVLTGRPAPGPAEEPAGATDGPLTSDASDELLGQLQAWVADNDGTVPTRPEIRARFRISTDRAAALRAAALAGAVR